MKTYKLIYGQFIQIWIKLPGDKSVQVEFAGGSKSPIVRPGVYRTDNPNIQAGLESHPWFGKRFELAGESVTMTPLVGAKTVAIGTPTTRHLMNSMQDTPEPAPIPVPAPVETVLSVPDITNGQDAKRWLYDNRKIAITSMRNNEAILKIAAEQQVKFPDWV